MIRLWSFRASFELRHPTSWCTTLASIPDHRMGCLCSWYGLREGLEDFDRSSSITWSIRGWSYVQGRHDCRETNTDRFSVFPGAVYIIGSWYRQFETAKRVSIFYMAALLASGFGPIVCFEMILQETSGVLTWTVRICVIVDQCW